MRDIIMKISALLLAVWYCISIVGFDLHVCHRTDRTYVSSFVDGGSCHDIHPEHCCSKGHCTAGSVDPHDHADGPVFKSQSCCTDDYKVLTVACDFPDNGIRSYVKVSESVVPFMDLTGGISSMIQYPGMLYRPDIGHRSIIVCADAQSAFSVWRI